MSTHTHMSTHMASANISIRKDVYQALKRRKLKGESFSDVLERLLQRPARFSDFFGAWSDMTPADWKAFESHRKRSGQLDEARRKRLDRSWKG